MVKNWKNAKMRGGKKGGPPIYFLGFIGAVVYYLHISSGFGSGVVAFLKALVWPAFLIYHLLGL
jgi:hypothetical protein